MRCNPFMRVSRYLSRAAKTSRTYSGNVWSVSEFIGRVCTTTSKSAIRIHARARGSVAEDEPALIYGCYCGNYSERMSEKNSDRAANSRYKYGRVQGRVQPLQRSIRPSQLSEVVFKIIDANKFENFKKSFPHQEIPLVILR